MQVKPVIEQSFASLYESAIEDKLLITDYGSSIEELGRLLMATTLPWQLFHVMHLGMGYKKSGSGKMLRNRK
jgi:hypothetical protein